MNIKWRVFGRFCFIFMAIVTIVELILGGCTDYPTRIKEANEAYERLKKQGFTDREIYEMGK